ncbi:hypothetical protein [Sphaerothrix gracilis]|uniref:hypothetical protein n=1 Tax=Sphaerothrix gracilis TaxID=3151835 RepID=UPI0031FC96C4
MVDSRQFTTKFSSQPQSSPSPLFQKRPFAAEAETDIDEPAAPQACPEAYAQPNLLDIPP